MFDGKKYVTRGVLNEIPPLLQVLMWQLIEELKIPKDALQIFQLVPVKGRQKIVHMQESPFYRKEYLIAFDTAVDARVYVIDDEIYSTMLLSDEY